MVGRVNMIRHVLSMQADGTLAAVAARWRAVIPLLIKIYIPEVPIRTTARSPLARWLVRYRGSRAGVRRPPGGGLRVGGPSSAEGCSDIQLPATAARKAVRQSQYTVIGKF